MITTTPWLRPPPPAPSCHGPLACPKPPGPPCLPPIAIATPPGPSCSWGRAGGLQWGAAAQGVVVVIVGVPSGGWVRGLWHRGGATVEGRWRLGELVIGRQAGKWAIERVCVCALLDRNLATTINIIQKRGNSYQHCVCIYIYFKSYLTGFSGTLMECTQSVT